jgi:type I restriction enzyme S subunit
MSKIKTMKECCSFQEGYVNPSKQYPEYFGGEIKWLRASDLNGFYVFDTEKKLSTKGFKSAGASAFMFKKDTLAISKSGTIGVLGILKNEMCGNRAVINIDVNPSQANLFYVFYLLKYKYKELVSKAHGSIQKNLYISALETITLNHKEISDQQKIASVLSALDSKIELNNRINAELEEMAKTIYDYWFVQFDFPDKNGKPYKTSGGKMVWNGELKREIPEGWAVKPLSEITVVSNESVNPMDFPDKEFKHYSIPDFDESGTFRIEKGFEIKSNKYTIKKTDVLVSKLNPWFSRVIYATDDSDLISSTEFVVWRTDNPAIKNYMYLIARDASFVSFCTKSASGTSNSHKRVNPTVMMKYKIVFDDTVATLFGNTLGSSIKMLAKNKIENQNLTELRDWLLPMLMNGQVKVK